MKTEKNLDKSERSGETAEDEKNFTVNKCQIYEGRCTILFHISNNTLIFTQVAIIRNKTQHYTSKTML